jgi:hypothetical protein
MASARQVAANRRNASLPRGPLSETASAAIRENALKHGMTAKHIVLGHEEYADYQELRASIVTEYQPQTPQEHRLADQIAQNYWRLLRSRRVETATFENRLGSLKDRLNIGPDTPMDHDEGLSVCMSKHAHDFENLRRYENGIERAWYRAIRELKATQRERREAEAAQAEEESYNPPLEDTIAERQTASATASPQKGLSVSSANSVTSVIKDLPAQVSENGIRCVSQSAILKTQPGT